jgi:hypothetical protein
MKISAATLIALLTVTLPLAAQQVPRLVKRGVIIPERGEVTGYLLLTPRAQLGFIPPGGWQVSLDAAQQRVQMIASNWLASVEFKLHWSEPGKAFVVDAAALRQRALGEQPGARVTEEFTCYALNQAGRACDLEFAPDGKTIMGRRCALIPFSGGVLEVMLTVPKATFASHHLSFAGFLNSLELNPSPPVAAAR